MKRKARVFTMPISTEYFRKIQDFDPALRDALLGLAQELDRSREETVTRDEFREVRDALRELTEAQQRTEARLEALTEAQQRTEARLESLTEAHRAAEGRLTKLETTVQELAEAQQRTEARIAELVEAQQKTEARLEALAEAQRRTEARLEALVEAQQRTEARVAELTEAHRAAESRLAKLETTVQELAEAQRAAEGRLAKLETTVQELAEAQKKTEKAMGRMTEEHRKTRQQVGGLSATVGYRLEDEAFKGLPPLLERDFGLELDSPLRRRFITDKEGRQVEVNIIGSGTRNGKKVTVLGEAKSQLSKRLVNEFVKKKLSRFSGVFEEILPVLVTYMISEPDAEGYVREKGVALYYSYDF